MYIYTFVRYIYIYTSYYLRNLITKVLYFPNQVVLKLFSGSVVTCNWRTQPLSSASNLCNYVQSVMRQTRCDMPQIKEASECTNQEVLSQPGFPDPVFTGSSQVTSIARCWRSYVHVFRRATKDLRSQDQGVCVVALTPRRSILS